MLHCNEGRKLLKSVNRKIEGLSLQRPLEKSSEPAALRSLFLAPLCLHFDVSVSPAGGEVRPATSRMHCFHLFFPSLLPSAFERQRHGLVYIRHGLGIAGYVRARITERRSMPCCSWPAVQGSGVQEHTGGRRRRESLEGSRTEVPRLDRIWWGLFHGAFFHFLLT